MKEGGEEGGMEWEREGGEMSEQGTDGVKEAEK